MKKSNKYSIEMTDGRISKFWEGHFTGDEQAIEKIQQEFRKFVSNGTQPYGEITAQDIFQVSGDTLFRKLCTHP
jgi:hypothetical protein